MRGVVQRSVWGEMPPAEVARREEARIARAVAEVALEFEEIAGGTVCWGGEGSWQNEGRGIGLAGPVAPADLDRMCAFLLERGGRPRIDVCPFADDSLFQGLAERRFTITAFENVLFRPVGPAEDFRALLPGGWPVGPGGEELAIEAVDPGDERAVRIFADVSGSGFRPAGTRMTEQEVDTARRVVRHPRVRAFVAWFGETPAGGGGAEAWEETSALFGVSVLPAFRGRGVQQALMAVRLAWARDMGCPIATIGSKPGIPTERNAVRMGFRVAYTKALMEQQGTMSDGKAPHL